MAGHDEFLELCAVSVSGELTDKERRKLDEHLEVCPTCRITFDQYRATVGTVIPRLASELRAPTNTVEFPWSEAKAEAAFFKRLKSENRPPESQGISTATSQQPVDRELPTRWGQFGMLYAAALLLFAALATSAYRLGETRGVESVAVNGPLGSAGVVSAKTELSDAGHDREVLLTEITARDQAIAELKQKIARETVPPINKSVSEVQSEVVVGTPNGRGAADAQRESGSSSTVVDLQQQLNAQEEARKEQVTRAAALETKVGELSKQLQNREDEVNRQSAAMRKRDDLLEQKDKTIEEQQDLLAHDRDIRDLMSARDLYIAEVYDVAKTGQTNKPYGRIFYTRGKSLLFYAYDLDQQPGLKNASTFQVWGRRGTSQDQALSLGILYEDNVANKRWVVKSEDAKTLEQIDAVFVTVEPNGGSQRPSGKPLLFAYLRIHPNHP